jgi:hypothetical protein
MDLGPVVREDVISNNAAEAMTREENAVVLSRRV